MEVDLSKLRQKKAVQKISSVVQCKQEILPTSSHFLELSLANSMLTKSFILSSLPFKREMTLLLFFLGHLNIDLQMGGIERLMLHS